MDLEVNVLGREDRAAAAAETSSSSSFGDTCSGCDDDAEAGPPLSGDDGGCNKGFRTKRLTAHWRNFIRPLMWRCHWIELRMKELRSQASKYDKELAFYTREKQSHSEMVESENTASRSFPLTCLSHRKQAMVRRKRRRKEDILDISSYMSRHNIFSYYENTRPVSDGYLVDDDCSDQDNNYKNGPEGFGPNSEWPMCSSLEQILFTIESVQSRVIELKTRLTNVISRNSGEISSSHGNFVHGGPPLSAVPLSVSCSAGNTGDAMPIGALNASPHDISEYDMEDPVMAGSTVSSYGEAAEVDVLESTIGLLSSADRHPDWQENSNDILINNQTAEEELLEFEISHAVEKPHEVAQEEVESSFEGESTDPTVSVYEVGLARDMADISQQQLPAPKPSYTGKRRGRKPKKKKRGGVAVGSRYLTSDRCKKQRVT